MLAVMGQSADALFATVNQQLLRIFAEAERQAAAGGGPPPSRGAKYALNIMLQGMNVPSIAQGITQVRTAAWGVTAVWCQAGCSQLLPATLAWLACRQPPAMLRASHASAAAAAFPAPQPTLRDSISLLLLRLLEEHGLLHFEEGATLVKAVNVLMLKILECRRAQLPGCGVVYWVLHMHWNVLMLKILECRRAELLGCGVLLLVSILWMCRC